MIFLMNGGMPEVVNKFLETSNYNVVHEEQQKILSDIGLLICMYGYQMKEAIVTDSLSGTVKGGIYENLVADFLVKKNYPLYYFKRDDSSSEVEFLIEKECSVVPVEVKAKNGSSSSLESLLKKDGIKYGYNIINGNVGQLGKKITIPHYMCMFL